MRKDASSGTMSRRRQTYSYIHVFKNTYKLFCGAPKQSQRFCARHKQWGLSWREISQGGGVVGGELRWRTSCDDNWYSAPGLLRWVHSWKGVYVILQILNVQPKATGCESRPPLLTLTDSGAQNAAGARTEAGAERGQRCFFFSFFFRRTQENTDLFVRRKVLVKHTSVLIWRM